MQKYNDLNDFYENHSFLENAPKEVLDAEEETKQLEKELLKIIGKKHTNELSDLISTLESIWFETGFKCALNHGK